MNKHIPWYVGFFVAAAITGLLLKQYSSIAPLFRTLITIGAGIGGGLLAEHLMRPKPKDPRDDDGRGSERRE